MKKELWIPQAVAGAMLLWALYPDNPYGYQKFIRCAFDCIRPIWRYYICSDDASRDMHLVSGVDAWPDDSPMDHNRK